MMTCSFPFFSILRSTQPHTPFKGLRYSWTPLASMALILGLFNPFMSLLLPQASATHYPVSILPTEKLTHPAVSIFKGIKVAPESARVDLNLRNTSIVDILQLLAEQGHFNIIVDESVTGVMTVDIKNISVNKALEYIFITGGLSYTQEGNTLVVANTATTNARSLNAKIFKVIPIKYRDAGQISTKLNQTIFAANKPGTNNMAVATFDPNTNSLLVVATDREVALIEELLPQLDIPRNRKVFKVLHGDANTIALNVFTTLTAGWADNVAGTSNSGGGAAAGGGGGAAAGGGGGAAAGGAGAAAGGGGGAAAGGGGGAAAGGGGGAAAGGGGAAAGGGGAAAGGGGAAAGGAGAAAGGGGTYARGGFSMVPNQATGTVTVYGTPDQLKLVEELIQELDVARPQVMIELSLVELTKSNTKIIQPITTGPIGFGEFRIGVFDTGATYAGKALGILGGGSGNGSVGKFQLPGIGFNFNNNDTKAKVLANPTLIAVDGTTSSVSITDTIVYFTSQITIPAAGGVPVVTWQANSQEVGIKLELTPVLHNDGNVTMALKPSVTQLIALKEGGNGAVSAPEIATREFTIASARVKDGQTLAIGGLLRDTRSESWDKIPGLANLPIVGAMFRSTSSAGNQTQRTELVVLVTPHILKEDINSPYFDGNPKPASDSDPLIVPQHGRTGTPASPSDVKVMGDKGGELKIETGRLVMPEPQATKTSEKPRESVKRKQAKIEDPYSVTPYNDYIGGLNRTFGSNLK